MNTAAEELRRGFTSRNLSATFEIAARFARELPENCAIKLIGDLGSGKTAFVKGMAVGLGIRSQITSPSFNICLLYDIPNSKRKLVHIDAYRLNGAQSFYNLLLDDIVGGSRILCIEWPQNIDDADLGDCVFEIEARVHSDGSTHSYILK